MLFELSTASERWAERLEWVERGIQVLSALALVVHYGFHKLDAYLDMEIGIWSVVALTWLGFSTIVRYQLCRDRALFRSEHRTVAGVYLLWLIGIVVLTLVGPWNVSLGDYWRIRWDLAVRWTELMLALRISVGAAELVRNVHVLGWSPALILVMSFVLLDLIGTFLLWLPASRHPDASANSPIAPWMAAFYTSTSACCVTGLNVVDTASYWTRTGQTVILCLVQIGGLGIMTFGGFVALISGRAMQMGEGVLFRELFESDRIDNVRRMVLSVLLFTFLSELVGAVLLWGLWPELPWGERLFYCVFHSVAAFCNAGFALTPHNANFLGYGLCWQVWGVISLLVILGGLGFGVMHDLVRYLVGLFRNWQQRGSLVRVPIPRARLGVNAALVLTTTAILLIVGTAALFFLDRGGSIGQLPWHERLAAAWFQSVIARTAGFNSVDIGALQPATKLILIILMFIGASPVSTGGGVKTASVAMGVLAFLSVLRGREQVEIWGRSIPENLVKRASLIIGTGLLVVVTATLLLTLFEQQHALFLDYLFESTSAFATVGLSTGISGKLSTPSLLVVIVTMFMGRVGPLTLFLAVGGRTVGARYQFPPERITLG